MTDRIRETEVGTPVLTDAQTGQSRRVTHLEDEQPVARRTRRIHQDYSQELKQRKQALKKALRNEQKMQKKAKRKEKRVQRKAERKEKCRNRNRRIARAIPFLLIVLAVMWIAKYLQAEYPDMFQRYPAVEWAVKVFLKVADFGYAIVKFVAGTVAELLNPLFTQFKQSPNWQTISNEWANLWQQFLAVIETLRF